MGIRDLSTPLSEQDVRGLSVGDLVRVSGVIVTARDAAHKFMMDTFIRTDSVAEAERPLHGLLQGYLRGGVIYHCGPIVRQEEDGHWEFVAAGPTTSMREEPYEPAVIAHFGLRGIIGKGGMGSTTLKALKDHGAVYFHAVGGAASLLASSVQEVLSVHKQAAFGLPEAFWVVRVKDLPLVVTMDSRGGSLHERVAGASRRAFERLLGG